MVETKSHKVGRSRQTAGREGFVMDTRGGEQIMVGMFLIAKKQEAGGETGREGVGGTSQVISQVCATNPHLGSRDQPATCGESLSHFTGGVTGQHDPSA